MLKVLSLLCFVAVLQALHQTHMEDAIDWDEINQQLRPEDPDALFKKMDNGNGKLSTFEVTMNINRVLGLYDLARARTVVNQAFKDAKDTGGSSKYYVEQSEFSTFLRNLRQYYEYYVAFERVDESGDGRIALIEFVDGKEKIEKWIGKFDPEAEFKKVDTNDGGYILFEEWVRWAEAKKLDLEDDID